jgi:hypothetical protein
MSAPTVYTTDSLDAPLAVQEEFTSHFDMNQPMQAVQDYAKMMHMHTKQQMEDAARQSRRRKSAAGSMATLSNESSVSSVDSAAS